MPTDQLPRLLLLTDRSQLHLSRGLLPTLAECRDAGLTHVVLRELDEPLARRAALAIAAADLGLTVIAAHTPLPGAAGLHLPAADGASPDVTACRPRGRSCHTRAEVARAAGEGFDYATLSPYAASDSKPGYGPPLGPGGLADAVPDGRGIPVYALGGITTDNAAEAVAAGAYGVAVMGAVMRAADPAGVVRALIAAVGAVAEAAGAPA
ncbi:thiamine phosphate synthase [Nocardioides sp. KR10-350]|uniref:thiamine phosphate synthase n=1 Tax=Nocardioides cheoyonin TaxID=3156615 RepID=UPI0032B5BEF3